MRGALSGLRGSFLLGASVAIAGFVGVGCGGSAEEPVVVRGRVFDSAGRPVWTATTSLYRGRLRSIYSSPSFEPVDTTTSEEGGRFELRADTAEGRMGAAKFFVFVTYKAGFAESCAYIDLPPVRLQELPGETAWIEVRTGEPLPSLMVASANEAACSREPVSGL